MERSCKNCQQRRVGCHANCERYKADCAQDAKRRAYEKQFAYNGMPFPTYFLAKVRLLIIRAKLKRIHDRLMGGPAKETQA